MQDERIVKVTSPFENGVTQGNLCVKGRFGFDYANEPGPGNEDPETGTRDPATGSGESTTPRPDVARGTR